MAEEQDEQIQRVQEFIKGQVKTYFDEQVADASAKAQQQWQQNTQQWQQNNMTPQQQAYQQAGQFIKQFTDPDVSAAHFKADDSRDYVDFYMSNPLAHDYKDQVEQAFNTMKEAGRPTTRADVLRYLRGREMEQDPSGFADREKQRQSRQLDRATSASDIGAMALARGQRDAETFGGFDNLSVEEMEKRLDGITF